MSAPVSVSHVYVHAPFCTRRCRYCDFAVSVRRSADPMEWARAIGLELRAAVDRGVVRLERPLRTLYVGGGTPSLLGSGAMDALLDASGPDLAVGAQTEWTAEANPESFTPDVASAWRSAGVGRVSLGVQSFDEGVLRWMGRLHGADGAVRAVETARSAGYDDLSIDLIFGTPETLERQWSEDLRRAAELDVEHVSLYGLTAEKGTPLGRDVAQGVESLAGEERYREEYLEAADRLTAAGFHHYEVSNFARPGHESRHNSAYWSGTAYLGLGNGAHSFLPPERRWNLREWEGYLQSIIRQGSAVAGSEALDQESERLERVWLGLRTAQGIPLSETSEQERMHVDEWVREGWATIDTEAIRLTPEGWLVLDELAVRWVERAGPDSHVDA